jgi:hypothetical protein
MKGKLIEFAMRRMGFSILSPFEFFLARTSELNGTPIVDWDKVLVRDTDGTLFKATKSGRLYGNKRKKVDR